MSESEEAFIKEKGSDVLLHHRAPRNRVRYFTVHGHMCPLPPRAPHTCIVSHIFPSCLTLAIQLYSVLPSSVTLAVWFHFKIILCFLFESLCHACPWFLSSTQSCPWFLSSTQFCPWLLLYSVFPSLCIHLSHLCSSSLLRSDWSRQLSHRSCPPTLDPQ